ncbi:hypothetical protein ABT352_15665 [Streptosporangium sp. NPDC000563]
MRHRPRADRDCRDSIRVRFTHRHSDPTTTDDGPGFEDTGKEDE